MIDEIRKIKLAPILEKLKKEDKIKSSIEELSEKIKQVEEEARRKNDGLPNCSKEKDEIDKLKNELYELEKLKEEKSRIENASIYDLGMDFQEAVEFLQRHNVEIVLTEEDRTALYNRENQKKDIKGLEDLILVHKTDYPPKDGRIKSPKEGQAKIEKEININGIEYQYEVDHPRETLHFYLNGEVGSNDGGSWNNCKYAILIPFPDVKKENLNAGKEVDTYFNGGVDIPNSGYILCPKGEREKIQRENPNITVIGYEGERVLGYGNTLVSALGYYEEGLKKNYWDDEKHRSQVKKIYEKEGIKQITHKGTEENKNEHNRFDVLDLIEKCKVVKLNINDIVQEKKDLYTINLSRPIFYEHTNGTEIKEFTELILDELEKNGINISEQNREIINWMFLEDTASGNNGFKKIEEIKEMIKRQDNIWKEFSDYCKMNKIILEDEKDMLSNMLNYSILSAIGKNRLLQIEEKKRQSVLAKKMKDFEISDEDFSCKNATKEESEIRKELIENKKKEINNKLKEKGIDKYLFEILGNEFIVVDPSSVNFEDIDKALQGKLHYRGIGRNGAPTLDFEEKEDETVGEYLERLEKYTDCFSKYYDGHTVDESVRFDENGDLIEEQKKPNYEKVAKSKEAVIEIQPGKTVQEIRDEMNPDKTKKEEVGTAYGE